MNMRPIAPLLILTLVACFADPGYHMAVRRPLSEPVERACVVRALGGDSTFSVDSISRLWIYGGDTTATIGRFRWRVASWPWPDVGGLYTLRAGGDALLADWGGIGVAKPDRIQRAVVELNARVNAVVDQCAHALAPARCEFAATGHGTVPCAGG